MKFARLFFLLLALGILQYVIMSLSSKNGALSQAVGKVM